MEESLYAQWHAWRGDTATEDAGEGAAEAAAASLARQGAQAELPAIGIDLNRYTVLGFEGRDARSFLQGYVTCDVEALAPERALCGAFTDLKGRVITDFLLLELDAMPAIVIDRSVEALLRASLQKYLNFARAALVDLSERYLMLGVLAPDSDDALPGPGEALSVAEHAGGRVVTEPGPVARLRCLLPPEPARELWQRYREAQRSGEEMLWRLADILGGIAHIRHETSGQFLPQMLDLDRLGAISFTKGCYLGQEVVARAQHRGQVKRRLRRLAWQGPAPPEPGTELREGASGARAMLVSAAVSETHAGDRSGLALAVMGVGNAPERLQGGEAVFTPQEPAPG